MCILGLTQWNQNSFEFKFDDTRLSSWYKKGQNWNFCLLRPDFAKSLPCWLSHFRRDRKTSICSSLDRLHIYQIILSFSFYFDIANNRVSHCKVNKVIWLCWGYRFWFLLIFFILHLMRYGHLCLVHHFLFFWCCAPSRVQLVNSSCSLIFFDFFWLLGASFT